MDPIGNDTGTYEARLEHTRRLLEEYAGKREHICLAFSGGKESVVLAHLLGHWRDRTTLVWARTVLMAPHMEAFIRGYGEDFRLVEVPAEDPREVWATYGYPSPLARVHSHGQTHDMVLTRTCCTMVISKALWGYYGHDREPLRITGVRHEDGPVAADVAQEVLCWRGDTKDFVSDPDHPNAVLELKPLWAWTQEDVFRFVDEHGLQLPIQYAEGCIDSLECLVCPGKLYPQRLAFLKKHYPEEARYATGIARANLKATYEAVEYIRAALDNEVWITPA